MSLRRPPGVALSARCRNNGAMLLSRKEIPILLVNVAYMSVFTVVALRNLNFEFLLYVGVVLVIAGWILCKQRTVLFPRPILWGLTVWGLMHMVGGNIRLDGAMIYSLQLIPKVLRFDQLVHAFGFGVATLVCHHLLTPYLKEGITGWGALSVLIVLMGSGLGAINEIIEFVAERSFKETGVGGYDNTLWDLVFNLIGATLAVFYLAWRRRRTLSPPGSSLGGR